MPSDAAFRWALAQYGAASYRKGRVMKEGATADELNKADDEQFAAYSRVLALYAERQGEEYEVQWLDYTPTLLLTDKDTAPKTIRLSHVFLGPQFKPGDRVRVRRCEEGV